MDNVTYRSVVKSSLCYYCHEKNSSYREKFENPFHVTHTKIIFTIAFTAVCSVCVLGKYMEPYINFGLRKYLLYSFLYHNHVRSFRRHSSSFPPSLLPAIIVLAKDNDGLCQHNYGSENRTR